MQVLLDAKAHMSHERIYRQQSESCDAFRNMSTFMISNQVLYKYIILMLTPLRIVCKVQYNSAQSSQVFNL